MVWRAEGARIVERHADVEVPEVGAPDTFGNVEHLGMRIDANPALIVVADGVDDECVTVPLTDRVSHPARIGILWMRTPIHEDLTEAAAILEQHHQQRRRLDQLRTECTDRGGSR